MFSSFWSTNDECTHVQSIEFSIQGNIQKVSANDISPETTLNEYLRKKRHLVGTKKMCTEGGCGTCIVAVKKPGNENLMAVNSCLVSILTCHGWKIDTIEGIGGPLTQYHQIQKLLADYNGTQCGFCSPGMVMNMYALSQNGKPTMKEVENSFGGNICRCTGYRPILSAFKSLCNDAPSRHSQVIPDMEDFFIVEPGSLSSKSIDQQPFQMTLQDTRWIKVVSLQSLLNKLSAIKDQSYMLVAGNTGKGVYELPTPKVYIDIIDVKELISYDLRNDVLILGGNMSLRDTITLFKQISSSYPKFAHLKKMANHMELVANVAVRNIGTLAGNLMLKYLHPEFPSDIFLLLETFFCSLIIVDSAGREDEIKLPDFLGVNMNHRVIRSIKIPSLSKNFKYETYKIMPRAQNAHAFVNAGILVQLNTNDQVTTARIVFGNISRSFIHAIQTENCLIGKNLFRNDTFQAAFKTLDEEMIAEELPPEPSPEFRKQLAISLLYKAFLSFAPDGRVSKMNTSGKTTLQRPLSNGMQEYETNKNVYPLTEAIPKITALAQTSGQAQYVDDIPDYPDQLYGKFVRANFPPNTKIKKIDATKALALNGVVKFLTKDDIPGANNFIPNVVDSFIPEKIFCDGVVEYFHQPVGLLVASNDSILKKAADLVQIIATNPQKPPLLNVRDILDRKATERLTKEREMKPAKLGDDVKHTIVGKYDIGSQSHFHMETLCCLSVPLEDSLSIYTPTHWMDATQAAVAEMLKIRQNRINVVVRRCGGSFGGKINRSTQIACATSLAAWLLRKPVRMALTLKENMESIGKRYPFSADYVVKVNNAGVIQHLDCKLYSDAGIGGTEKLKYQASMFALLTANYDPNPYELVYYLAKTDTPGNTSARAPGSAEGLGFIESVMDHIAAEIAMDPIDVRINNISKEKKLIDYMGDLKEWADVDERQRDMAIFNRDNRWRKRGISIVPMAWKYQPFGPITSTVSIYHVDGSVTISHGGVEMGQGIDTKAVQVCAYKFNIPIDMINVYPTNSVVSPNALCSGGSTTTAAVCYGVNKACDELLSRLEPYRKPDTAQTWVELIQAASAKFVLLQAVAQFDPSAPFVNPYTIYGACATEVEVDILTGQHQISRVDIIEDVGTSLSPLIDIGQVEGAFIMGVGYYTTEKLIFDKDGRMLTNNTWYYQPPTAQDIPIDFRVRLPKNNPNPLGVLQSKAVGEPPLCMSVSVPLAIRRAVASARGNSDSSKPRYFFFNGPTTVEETFMNSLNDYKQYTL